MEGSWTEFLGTHFSLAALAHMSGKVHHAHGDEISSVSMAKLSSINNYFEEVQVKAREGAIRIAVGNPRKGRQIRLCGKGSNG